MGQIDTLVEQHNHDLSKIAEGKSTREVIADKILRLEQLRSELAAEVPPKYLKILKTAKTISNFEIRTLP